MNWRTLTTVMLIIAALIAWSFWLRRDTVEIKDLNAHAPRGYYLQDARLRQTGPNGDARYALHAQRIEQDPVSNRVKLTRVELNYRSDSGTNWLLNADRGALDNAGQQADFNGHVFIRPVSSSGTTHLLTESLHLDMNKQLASTREPVILQMDTQQLNAHGLQANLKAQTLKLESQVHGVFQMQSGTSSPAASP